MDINKYKTAEIRDIKRLIDDLEIYIQRSVHTLTLNDYTFKNGYISDPNIDKTRTELYNKLQSLDNLLYNSYDDGK